MAHGALGEVGETRVLVQAPSVNGGDTMVSVSQPVTCDMELRTPTTQRHRGPHRRACRGLSPWFTLLLETSSVAPDQKAATAPAQHIETPRGSAARTQLSNSKEGVG